MQVRNNALLEGLSGHISDLVFSQRFGKTIISKKPDYSKKPPATPAQEEVKAKFKAAAAYAKAATADPAVKMIYQKKTKNGLSAYNCAVADFFNPPVIDDIDTGNYLQQPGSSIRIEAMDDCMVKTVYVKIERLSGALVEEGPAVLTSDKLHWFYTVAVTTGSTAGNIITVTATDLAGNKVVKQKIV